MTTKRLRVGLLGAGYILQAHAKALQALPHVEIAAVCDVSRGRAEAAAASFGIPGVFTSLAEMLKSGIDAVHVLVPPQLHIDVTRQILEAGVVGVSALRRPADTATARRAPRPRPAVRPISRRAKP